MLVRHSEKDTSRNCTKKKINKEVCAAPLWCALRGTKSQEVIAHLCVFMPNQAQQRAAPPACAIDWEGRGGSGGGWVGGWRDEEEEEEVRK